MAAAYLCCGIKFHPTLRLEESLSGHFIQRDLPTETTLNCDSILFPNGIDKTFITFPANHFITKSTEKECKSRFYRIYQRCKTGVAVSKKRQKNTLSILVRQFAKWLTARENQTKTLEYKVKNSFKNVDTTTEPGRTHVFRVLIFWLNSEKLLRNTIKETNN